MTKAEKLLKEITEREAARKAAGPIVPTPAPRGPNKYAAMSGDRKSALLSEIIFDLEQPRKYINEMRLARMAATIGRVGVIQPVKLRWLATGKWQVVVGERRVRAARLAGLTEIPFVEEGAEVADLRKEIQLVENIQKDALTPSELAAAIKESIATNPGRTQKEVALRLGLSEANISEVLAASELPPPIMAIVDAGMIPVQVGAALAKIKDGVEQAQLAEKIVKEEMNRVDAMREVKGRRPRKKKDRNAKSRNAEEHGHELRIKLNEVHTVVILSAHPIVKGIPLDVARLFVATLEQEDRRAAA